MKTKDADIQTVSVSDFKTHCTTYLRSLEQTSMPLHITRHGTVVARLSAPEPSGPLNLSAWFGSGKGLVSEGFEHAFDEPTWQEGDWAMQGEEPDL